MSNFSSDLIDFTDLKNESLNTKRESVLEEFDPLFDIKAEKDPFCKIVRRCSKQIQPKNQARQTDQLPDKSQWPNNHRFGGVFDKDKIWCELQEFALNDNLVKSHDINHSNTFPNLLSYKQSRNSRATYQICIDSGLLNFAKAVENCAPRLPPIQNTSPFDSGSIEAKDLPSTQSPVLLNAYILDAILASPSTYHLELGSNDFKFDDYRRLNPGLMSIAHPSCTDFLPIPSPGGSHDLDLKIYVPLPAYFGKRYEDTLRNWMLQRLQTRCQPTKCVSTLIAECLERVYGSNKTPAAASTYCLRIFGRTDLLHPSARLCDHAYIQYCFRTDTAARLVLASFCEQECFLPTFEDRDNQLNLHESYDTETRIPHTFTIEKWVNKIGLLIESLRKQVSNFSCETTQVAGNTCELIRQALVTYISEICHGTAIGTLLLSMAAAQNSLYNLMLSRKPQKHPMVLQSLSSSRQEIVEDEAKIVIERLAILDMQLFRQTIAFLKWKQAWCPSLELPLHRSSKLFSSSMECERVLGCQMAPRNMSHRISKCDMPFVMRIGGVVDPVDPSRLSDLLNGGGCVRVHVILTYAGRPLSTVCLPNAGPSQLRSFTECSEYACTTPVLRDCHYSRRADFNVAGKIDEWIRFVGFPFRRLPRETLLNVSLIALKKQTEDPATLNNGTLIGWVNVPLFDANGRLRQEVVLAGLWPPMVEGLSPEMRSTFAEPNRDPTSIVVDLEFPVYECDFCFAKPPAADNLNVNLLGLPDEKRCHLIQLTDRYLFTSANSQNSPCERRPTENIAGPRFTDFLSDLSPHQALVDELWQHRGQLIGIPELFSTLLIIAPARWPSSCWRTSGDTKFIHDKILWMFLLSQLYGLIQLSAPLPPTAALRLLLPDVPDQFIRHWAVSCIARLPPDGIICYLPSLLEAVNYDIHFDWSGLVSLLLNCSTVSLRFCNALYWNIESILMMPKWHSQRRLVLLKTAIGWLRGSRLKATWSLQGEMIRRIGETAEAVKMAKDKMKLRALQDGLESMQLFLDAQFKIKEIEARLPTPSANSCPAIDSFRLPYDFGFCSRGFKSEVCTCISSFTCPIRLTLAGIDGETRKCIFKVGDDLQMDLLICQLISLADRIWLGEGIDLCIPQFLVMPTEPKRGFIEPVPESETLRRINQTNAKRWQGLLTWLKENQRTTKGFDRAIQNFANSTVAGSVLTFVLGLGDRHNDNIMMCTNGQSFHIDFAKVFGNFQKILSFNRDRSPFILTPDMLEVVKSAESSSSSLLERNDLPKELVDIPSFVRHCCRAYNHLRRHTFSIMGVLEMAWQMQLPGLERGQIGHVYGNLRRAISDCDAEAFFKELIQRSIQSYAAQLNNMIHDKMQRIKKQPSVLDNSDNKGTLYAAQEVYLPLDPSEASSTTTRQFEDKLDRLLTTDAALPLHGWYSKDPSTMDFWKQTESDLRLQQTTTTAFLDLRQNGDSSPDSLLDAERSIYGSACETINNVPPLGVAAVQLTLELSASGEELNVSVDQGHDWWLPEQNLTSGAVIEARISLNSARTILYQRPCVLLSNDPKLNESFTIEIPQNECKEASLMFAVRQLDTSGFKHLIGEASIPLISLPRGRGTTPSSTSNKITQWYELSRRSFERV